MAVMYGELPPEAAQPRSNDELMASTAALRNGICTFTQWLSSNTCAVRPRSVGTACRVHA